jgi:transcriptional activator of cad operon
LRRYQLRILCNPPRQFEQLHARQCIVTDVQANRIRCRLRNDKIPDVVLIWRCFGRASDTLRIDNRIFPERSRMLMANTRLKIGEYLVDFISGELRCHDTVIQLDARLAKLLMVLARHAGRVLSIDELLEQAWEGVIVSPDSVYQAITALRKILGDDAKNPTYIATVPKRGYKLIAAVSLPDIPPAAIEPEPAKPVLKPIPAYRRKLLAATVIFSVLVCTTLFWAYRHAQQHEVAPVSGSPAHPSHAIAVLPFLDLTDDMTEEPFADGMVEELINQLSGVRGLAVSPAANSFYYKDKQMSAGDIARALHVAFTLEGSVRKSASTLRVTIRLTRAADGFVVWAETYDRPWVDKIKIQDDIAREVSSRLAMSLN